MPSLKRLVQDWWYRCRGTMAARRAMRMWRATGTLPVAHIVAELD